MASHPCSAVLRSTGLVCGLSRNAPIHLRTSGDTDAHPHLDSRGAARLSPQSASRTAYVRSEAHQRAYEHVEGECIFFAGGAPLDCFGPVTPGHIVPRSVAGSLEEADRWPVAPQCALHNREVDANPELREWSSTHTFMWHDGKHYRYRYDRPTYERELLASSTSTKETT